MKVSITTQINVALQAGNSYLTAIEKLRTSTAGMEREEFRAEALPLVATYYRVKPLESSRGGVLMLEKDTAAATFLKRLVRDVFPSAATSGRAEPVAIRLNAGELALARQLAAMDTKRVSAIVARAKQLRGG